MKIKSYQSFLFALTLTAVSTLTYSPMKTLCSRTVSAYAATKNTKSESEKRLKSDLKKVLSLRVEGYQDMTLKEFENFVTTQFEDHRSIWRAKERLTHIANDEIKKYVTEEEFQFFEITLPCTFSESDNPYDRSVAFREFPATFSDRFDLYSKWRATTCHFEYSVRYITDLTKTTVRERDAIVLKVTKGMERFVKKSTIDPAKKEFDNKINKKLDALLKKYTTPEIELKVFQYPAK